MLAEVFAHIELHPVDFGQETQHCHVVVDDAIVRGNTTLLFAEDRARLLTRTAGHLKPETPSAAHTP